MQTQSIKSAKSIQKIYKGILDKVPPNKLHMYEAHTSIVQLKDSITMDKIRELVPSAAWSNRCSICNKSKEEIFTCTKTDKYLNPTEVSVCEDCNNTISVMYKEMHEN